MHLIRKGNRTLKTDKVSLSGYLKRGYDEIDEKGNIVTKATDGKVITAGEYNKVLAELEAAKAGNTSGDIESNPLVKELRKANDGYAKDHEILNAKIKELEEDIAEYEKETVELEARLEKTTNINDNSKPKK